jgi:hypothetical protein
LPVAGYATTPAATPTIGHLMESKRKKERNNNKSFINVHPDASHLSVSISLTGRNFQFYFQKENKGE